ncbi:MAG: hypothetical protein WAT66_00130 [Actinomycetota bacterium]
MTTTAVEVRPLAVRVLRVAGLAAAAFGLLAFVIGAILGFDNLAVLWAVVAGLLAAIAAAALAATRPSRAGLASGLVACCLMLLLPPVGTLLTIAIGLLASQTWPQLREYYGVTRRSA